MLLWSEGGVRARPWSGVGDANREEVRPVRVSESHSQVLGPQLHPDMKEGSAGGVFCRSSSWAWGGGAGSSVFCQLRGLLGG